MHKMRGVPESVQAEHSCLAEPEQHGLCALWRLQGKLPARSDKIGVAKKGWSQKILRKVWGIRALEKCAHTLKKRIVLAAYFV